MKTIYKYRLRVTDVQSVERPEGAQILTVQMQYGEPCLWAFVETDKPVKPRKIFICGTGNPIDRDLCVFVQYIATFQMHNGGLVFHVFTDDDPTITVQ